MLAAVGVGAAAAGGLSASNVGATTDAESQQSAVGPTLVEADESAGFQHPYYLYAPADAAGETVPILVEPVNSGTPSDDFQQDLSAGERLVSGGRPRRIAEELGIPLVVPVFPNPRTGDHGDAFTQYLDRETMLIEEGPLARIDRQTLAMVDHAADRLASDGIDADPGRLHMNGFSASGNFVNKFALLHPTRVSAVTAGAVNGTPILPREEAKGYRLPYQLGIADYESVTGKSFDRAAWEAVDQLLYMGQSERPPQDDTLPYRGVWTAEQAETAYAVYGRDMQEERMPYSERVYDEAGSSAVFEVYDDTGHSYSEAIVGDVIAFHRAALDRTAVRLRGTPQIGASEVAIEAFLATEDAEQATLTVAGDNGERLSEPVTLPAGVSIQTDVGTSRPIRAGERLRVSLTTDTELATDTATADSRVAVTDRLVDGDSSISVAYTLAATAGESATLSVLPAGDGPYYERRIRLAGLSPGDGGTETFELGTDQTGVPFEAGDAVAVWLIPSGNQAPERAVSTAEVTVDPEPGSVSFAAVPADGGRELQVSYALAGWASGTATLEVEPGETWQTVRELSPGTERTETVSIEGSGVPFERGSSIGARIVPADGNPLDSDRTLVARDELVRLEPAELFAGDESATVGYAIDAAAPDGLTLDVRTAGESVTDPVSVAPGESGEATLSLDREAAIGDAFDVIVVSGETSVTKETIRVERIPSAEVSFASRPTADSETVTATVRTDDSFPDEEGRLRLFPDEGGGRYGLGLGFLDRGQETTQTYELDGPLSQFGLGTGVELRLFPSDWGYLEDVVAVDRTTISGVVIQGVVRPADQTVAVEYAVPETVSGAVTLDVQLAGQQAASRPVEPGETGTARLSLDSRPADGDPLVVRIVDAEPVITTETTVRAAPADVSFEAAPTARGVAVDASYGLAGDYDPEPFVTLRLYTESGSEYGTQLAEVTPGEETRETITVDPREGAVPFEPGETVRLAVVAGDDPYANGPLGTAETTVGGTVESTPTATPTATPTDTPTATPTVTPPATDSPTANSETDAATTTEPGTPKVKSTTQTDGSLPGWLPVAGVTAASVALARWLGADEE